MIDVIADRIVRKNPFLCDWSNYGIIDIFNPVATAQYQHSVTIPTKPGMMHDFRDLRFFQPDGTEIPFWNESKTDGSTSFNWIKPYSASQRKVYVFYGNRDAVSQSNGDKVFEFFDDFLGSALTSQWTNPIHTGTVAISASQLSLSTTNASGEEIRSSATFGTNTAIRTSIGWTKNYATGVYSVFGYYNGSVTVDVQNISNTGVFLRNNDGTAASTGVTSTQTGALHVVDIIRNGSTDTQYLQDGANSASNNSHVPSTSLPVSFFVIPNSGTTEYIYVGWVLVRKYTATEPVCQFNTFGLKV